MASPSIWNVPYHRNTFFTGREDILTQLHSTLTAGKTTILVQAIRGLGGIGKTQIAVEYAYRHREEYKAILWAKADSREILVSELVGIAELLNLPERSAQNQNRIVNEVKHWLQSNTKWLLILDNVEDLAMIREYLPSVGSGHVRAINRALPDFELTAHQVYQRCLPHVQACMALIEELHMAFAEAAQLLYQVAHYLRKNTQYNQAEPLYQRTLLLYKQTSGLEDAGTSTALENYVDLLQKLNRDGDRVLAEY